MKIFAWNVNGLRSTISKNAIQDLIFKHSPDVLCLGETKISAEQVNSEKIRDKFIGYDQYYSFAEKKGYSGTAVWVKKGVEGLTVRSRVEEGPLAPISSPSAEPATRKDGLALVATTDSKTLDSLNEGRITTVELPDFYIVSIYVPNSKEDLSRLAVRQEWDRQLSQYCAELQRKKPIIVCGDMNVARAPIDLARPKENEGKHGYTVEERSDIERLLEDADLVDTFRHLHPDTIKYSWWSHWRNARARNIGWRIDYILTSSQLNSRLTSADIYPEITGSDHCPISIEID